MDTPTTEQIADIQRLKDQARSGNEDAVRDLQVIVDNDPALGPAARGALREVGRG